MSWAIWITGLPGSGKSVIARAVAAELAGHGAPPTVLELDALRTILTPAPTYSATERETVYRALVYLAKVLTQQGVPVIIDATAHRRAWRDLARATIRHFAEVQLVCPLEVCRRREAQRTGGNAPRGIYAAAGRLGATVPGVDVPYEAALTPEALVDTAHEALPTAVDRVVRAALGLATASPAAPPPPPAGGWALWITGLPGSGKTTVASALVERLTARGIPVALLDLRDVQEFVRGHRLSTPREDEILHRALVAAAMLLTRAGVPVVIDATAPRRVWRQLARELIGQFAEIQLVCPSAICAERERAARWAPPARAYAGQRATVGNEGPDIAVDYEPALHPECIVHTDVLALSSVVDEILPLVLRLHRTRAICSTRP